MSFAVNLVLFFLLLAKVALLCGFAISVPLLIFGDRIRAIGFEQVSERSVVSQVPALNNQRQQALHSDAGKVAA